MLCSTGLSFDWVLKVKMIKDVSVWRSSMLVAGFPPDWFYRENWTVTSYVFNPYSCLETRETCIVTLSTDCYQLCWTCLKDCRDIMPISILLKASWLAVRCGRVEHLAAMLSNLTAAEAFGYLAAFYSTLMLCCLEVALGNSRTMVPGNIILGLVAGLHMASEVRGLQFPVLLG